MLRAFGYRWTYDNPVREEWWQRTGIPPEAWPRVPMMSDAEWLASHAFCVRKDGGLDARNAYAAPAFVAGTPWRGVGS